MFLGIINYPIEGLGYIKDILTEKGFEVKEKLATNINEKENYDGLIVMGGPMGVYETDRYRFLEIEMKLIRNSIENDKPVLGICLGSQLISASLGGEVKPGQFGKEIGLYEIYLLEDFRSLLGNSAKVFQWHGDTFTLPKGSKLLAYSEKYFQAFKYKKALALQFHVEVNSKIIEKWVDEYGGNNKLIEEVKENEEGFRKIAEKIINFWLAMQ